MPEKRLFRHNNQMRNRIRMGTGMGTKMRTRMGTKMKKAFFVAAALLAFALALAACGSPASKQPAATTASAAVTTAKAAETTAKAATTAAAAQAATTAATTKAATTAATTQAPATKPAEPDLKPITFSLFVDHSWFWIDSFGGRLVDDEITKRTGISFDMTKAADDKQLQVLIASGSYPDIIYTGTTSLWPKLSNPNICFDWNGLIEAYAPDFPATAIEISNATQGDGKFYTIYNAYSPPEVWKSEPRMLPSNGSATLHVRKDIMEAIGNPRLDSLDDLKTILATVKEQYPNMDEMLIGEKLYGLPYFRYCFGGESGGTRLWYDESAKEVKYRLEDPNEKKTVAYINSLFREGYIKPEALIYEVEQYRQKVYAGEAFSFVRSVTESDGANTAFQAAGMNAEATPVQKLLSEKPLMVNDGIGWSGTFITKNCKNPDRAIQFMSYMKSPEGQLLAEFGIEGVTFEYDSEGYPTLTQEVRELRSSSYTSMVDTYGMACWNFGVSAATEAIFNWNPKAEPIMNVLKNLGAVIQFRPWFQFTLPDSGTELRDTYSKIGSFVDQEIYKVIAAESEPAFEEAYDAMLNTCFTMGLDTVKTYVNEKYPLVKAKY